LDVRVPCNGFSSDDLRRGFTLAVAQRLTAVVQTVRPGLSFSEKRLRNKRRILASVGACYTVGAVRWALRNDPFGMHYFVPRNHFLCTQ
jgi:hypothetical protein